MIIVILFTLIVLQSIALYYSVKRNIEFLELFDNFSEDCKEAVEELDSYYEKIDKKSKLELFLDEPITRELVEEIKGTKKAIKKAAEKISVFVEKEYEES